MKVILMLVIKQIKQITKKALRDNTLDSDISPPEGTDDVTPVLDFACENANFIVSAEATLSTSDVDDDFLCHSTSTSEQQLSNEQPLLNETNK